jgi:hypothetical protein
MTILPVFFLAYFISSLIGAWFILRTFRFISKAKSTNGIVIGNVPYTTLDSNSSGNVRLIEMRIKGKKYTVESRVVTPFEKKKGEVISMLYDPKNPSEAIVDSFVELHFPWIIFLGVGVTGMLFVLPKLL